MSGGLEYLWNRKSPVEKCATIAVGEIHAATLQAMTEAETFTPADFLETCRRLGGAYIARGGTFDLLAGAFQLSARQTSRSRRRVAEACYIASRRTRGGPS